MLLQFIGHLAVLAETVHEVVPDTLAGDRLLREGWSLLHHLLLLFDLAKPRVLEGLGREELESILEEQGQVSVTCEFCNRNYAFDSVDIESLLSGRPASPTHTRKQ